jgi:hypothetical protein
MKLSFLALLLFAGCSSQQPQERQKKKSSVLQVKDISIENWPQRAKVAAKAMLKKYGAPNEISKNTLIWEGTSPFKRIVAHRTGIAHNFPTPHTDVLEHVVSYRIPAYKADELNRFDGSLSIDRTKGELSSRCDLEETNVLALNLADEVIKGSMSVESAREEFAHSLQSFQAGTSTRYTSALTFRQLPKTADADMPLAPPEDEQIQAEEENEIKRVQENLESDNHELTD